MSLQQEERDSELIDIPTPNEMFWGERDFENALSVPFPLFPGRTQSDVYPPSKRFMDLVVSFFMLVFGLPIFLVIGLAIKIDSKGSVFHKQKRMGSFGQEFEMWKFRTMIPNAEELLDDIKHLNEAEGKIFKMKDDPRVTRVGKFLRKYSLDELPQIFNVFRGEMSLVGNRPPLPCEVEEYSEWERRRLAGMPGISGLWQVNGRSELSFEKMVEMDVHYHLNRTFFMDLVILLKTVPAALSGNGAY